MASDLRRRWGRWSCFGTLVLLTTSTSSCLVLGDPEFRGIDECPPILLTNQANPPLTSIIHMTTLDERIDVPLRTCAVTQTLYRFLYVDEVRTGPQPIDPSGTELRSITFDLAAESFRAGCHQVRLMVSSDQNPGPTTNARSEAVWWVVVSKDSSSVPTIDSCPGYRP